MSLIRSIVDAIAAKLGDSTFFLTSPKIAAISEERHDVVAKVDQAMQTGALVLVNYESSGDIFEDSPGPQIQEAVFRVTVTEAPQIWRASNSGVPTATDISEAAMRLLHHWQPLDDSGAPIVRSVLIVTGHKQEESDSYLKHVITLKTSITLDNTEPERS